LFKKTFFVIFHGINADEAASVISLARDTLNPEWVSGTGAALCMVYRLYYFFVGYVVGGGVGGEGKKAKQ
jgi:hypothetical protein